MAVIAQPGKCSRISSSVICGIYIYVCVYNANAGLFAQLTLAINAMFKKSTHVQCGKGASLWLGLRHMRIRKGAFKEVHVLLWKIFQGQAAGAVAPCQSTLRPYSPTSTTQLIKALECRALDITLPRYEFHYML